MTVGGFAICAAGLVALLTINGATGVPSMAVALTSALIILGLLLPALGMLQMARAGSSPHPGARRGLEMLAAGLVVLLVGVVPIVVISSFSGYVAGASLIAVSGALALTGVVYFRKYAKSVVILLLGTMMIFSGVELIASSNVMAIEYWVSQVENTIYVDVGATVSACGCVLSAYSFFVLHGRS